MTNDNTFGQQDHSAASPNQPDRNETAATNYQPVSNQSAPSANQPDHQAGAPAYQQNHAASADQAPQWGQGQHGQQYGQPQYGQQYGQQHSQGQFNQHQGQQQFGQPGAGDMNQQPGQQYGQQYGQPSANQQYGQPQYGDQNFGAGYAQQGAYGQPKNNNKIIIAIAAIAAVIAIGLAIFFLTRGGGDVSKDDFRAGLEKATSDAGFDREQLKTSGLTDEVIDAYYDCLTEESFDEVSDDFKEMIANSDPNGRATSDDQNAFNTAINTCVSQLSQDLM